MESRGVESDDWKRPPEPKQVRLQGHREVDGRHRMRARLSSVAYRLSQRCRKETAGRIVRSRRRTSDDPSTDETLGGGLQVGADTDTDADLIACWRYGDARVEGISSAQRPSTVGH